MNDDNVRHLWSDAELDEALGTLNAGVRTDPAELDHARAALLRAAAAESGRAYTSPAAKKKRSGAWRWIAVAAAVALVTGGVVVAREVVERPATVEPAATPTADVRPAPGQYTHVTNTYTDVEWVADRSAFAVRQKVETWIPADPSDLWMRKWTRTSDATVITGSPGDRPGLPGPDSTTQVAPGGNFTDDFPHPGGWTSRLPASWYRPTPQFVATLPANTVDLKELLLGNDPLDLMPDGKVSGQPQQILPPMQSYPGDATLMEGPTTTTEAPLPPRPGSAAATYAAPGDRQMRPLTVLASGLASRPLRTALVGLLRSQASSIEHHGDVETTTINYGGHALVINVDTATSQLISLSNVASGNFFGIPAGQALSSASFGYEITSEFGS